MSWEQGEQAGDFLRPREVPGIQGCSRCEWSKLGARGARWGLSEAPGRFQGPRDAQGVNRASLESGT